MAEVEKAAGDTTPVKEEQKPKETKDIVPALREKFLEKYKDSLGEYYSQDIERMKEDDDWCVAVLSSSKASEDPELGADVIDNIFKFRKEYSVHDVDMDSMPKELIEKNAMFYLNKDKEGRKILHWKVAKHVKGQHVKELKQLVALTLDEHYKEHPLEKVCVLFDFTGTGLGQMDVDVVKFIVSCFTTYYPCYAAHILMYEMPWILGALMKIIKALLTEQQAKYVISVGKKNIQEYIDPDQLEEHMK